MKQMNQSKPNLQKVDSLVDESFSKIRKVMLKNKNNQEINMAITRLSQELFYQSIIILQGYGMPEDALMEAIEAFSSDAKSFAKSRNIPYAPKNEVH